MTACTFILYTGCTSQCIIPHVLVHNSNLVIQYCLYMAIIEVNTAASDALVIVICKSSTYGFFCDNFLPHRYYKNDEKNYLTAIKSNLWWPIFQHNCENIFCILKNACIWNQHLTPHTCDSYDKPDFQIYELFLWIYFILCMYPKSKIHYTIQYIYIIYIINPHFLYSQNWCMKWTKFCSVIQVFCIHSPIWYTVWI